MSIVLQRTEGNLTFLRIFKAHMSIGRGQVEVTFVQGSSEIVAEIHVQRVRDEDGQSRMLCAYREVLPVEAATDSESWCLSGDAVEELVKLTKSAWEVIEIPKDVPGSTRIEKASRDSVPSLLGVNARLDGTAFVNALEASAALPPLDVTKDADLQLTASESSLIMERRAGEVAFREKLLLLVASHTTAFALVPHELVSTLAEDLRGKRFVALTFPQQGGISIKGSQGSFYFMDYASLRRTAVHSRSPLVAFVSLSAKQLRHLEDALLCSNQTTSESPVTLELNQTGIDVSSRQPGVVEKLEVKVPVSRLSTEKDLAHTFRPESLLSVLTAARKRDREPFRFYFTAHGAFLFQGKESSCLAQAEKIDGFISAEEKPLILWASGGSAELIVRSPHRHILISFAEFSKEVQTKEGEFERYLEKRGLLQDDMKIFLDSGAYSVWQAGAEVDLEEYMRFLRWNVRFLDTYVALDVIRGAVRKNVENYLRMVDAGLAPLYVWHLYEDWDLLEGLLDEHKAAIQRGGIGAGGAPHTPYPIREPYVGEFIRRVSAKVTTRLHLFGTTSEWLLKKYSMVYSADSTSWRFLGDNHRIETPFGTFSTKPQSLNSLWNHRLCQEVSRFVESLPFRGEPFRVKDLATDRDTRHIYNLAYLNFFEEYYPYIDWMKLEQRFIPVGELKKLGKLNLDNSTIITPRPSLKLLRPSGAVA